MARIRSIRVELFTDEEFMELSACARLLFIGTLCHCDDHGVFSWKPKALAARILPGEPVDAVTLLEELIAAGFVRRFEADGGVYGAIKNFRVFQKPRRATFQYPFPPDIEAFVGSPDDPRGGGGPAKDGKRKGSTKTKGGENTGSAAPETDVSATHSRQCPESAPLNCGSAAPNYTRRGEERKIYPACGSVSALQGD